MSDPLADRKRIGARAQALLDDELLAEAFKGARAKFLNEFESSQPDGTVAREAAWARLQALGAVKQAIRSMVTSGELATAEINRLQAQSTRTRGL